MRTTRWAACITLAATLGACGGGGGSGEPTATTTTTTAAAATRSLSGDTRASSILEVPVPVEATKDAKGQTTESWRLPVGTTLADLVAFYDTAMPRGTPFAGYIWCDQHELSSTGAQRLYWKSGTGHYLTVVLSGETKAPGLVIGEDEETNTGCEFP